MTKRGVVLLDPVTRQPMSLGDGQVTLPDVMRRYGVYLLDPVTGQPLSGAAMSGSGGDVYQFVQSVPATEWTFTHGLNRYPSIVVVDSAGTTIIPDVEYLNQISVKLVFAFAVSGVACCN